MKESMLLVIRQLHGIFEFFLSAHIYRFIDTADEQLSYKVWLPISAIGWFLWPYIALEPVEIRTPVVPWYLPLTRRRPNGILSTVTGAQYNLSRYTSLTPEPNVSTGIYMVRRGIRFVVFFFLSIFSISKFIQRHYMGQSSVKNTFLVK